MMKTLMLSGSGCFQVPTLNRFAVVRHPTCAPLFPVRESPAPVIEAPHWTMRKISFNECQSASLVSEIREWFYTQLAALLDPAELKEAKDERATNERKAVACPPILQKWP